MDVYPASVWKGHDNCPNGKFIDLVNTTFKPMTIAASDVRAEV